ncbi:MAG: hypothetical protein CYPHOPRED_001341 [Cyphobasidiales sp. Tagirdzhanova-0007]|nr:MAG: hypothetical protein CYPHOPRED_001341 [Cyphobasidiales sp. Tagirdzhanova-0007]
MAITPLVLYNGADSDYPSIVTVHPVAVASLLDHHLRRPKGSNANEQDRVIGTLMGTRSESGEVRVLSSFGVPFGEVQGKLLLDTDALRQQLDIVSNFSETGNAALSNNITAAQVASPTSLITSFAPVHLTLDARSLAIKAYASSKMGLTVDTSNRTFVPLKTEMKVAKSEGGGIDVLAKHSVPTLKTDSSHPPSSTHQLVAPLVSLNGMLQEVSSMLDSVLSYVKQVNDGSLQGDAKIGRHLFETLASVPVPTSFKGTFDEDFNTHLADLLMVSYLANVVRVNLEVAARASMLHDARLAPRTT